MCASLVFLKVIPSILKPSLRQDKSPPEIPAVGMVAANCAMRCMVLRAEMQIALDRQAEPTAHGRHFLQAGPAKFGHPHAQIAQEKSLVVIVRGNLGQ